VCFILKQGVDEMSLKKIGLLCLIVATLILSPLSISSAADTGGQIVSNVEQILKANPFPEGKKIQIVNVAQDDAGTYNIVRLRQGGVIKTHIHKTHTEFVYVIKGKGKLVVNEKPVCVAPGSVHFNPAGKIHGLTHVGKEELVILSIFTPAMKVREVQFIK
jgi:quercetin dioxygenase-like cupin family protein